MKTERRKLKDKLEKLVKDFVKKRDNNTCQKCGKVVEGFNCHASHVIPVSGDGRLAFDELNIKVMCYHHHRNWWHLLPTESGEWFKEKFPERMAYLEEQRLLNQKKGSISLDWYRERIEYFKEKLDC